MKIFYENSNYIYYENAFRIFIVAFRFQAVIFLSLHLHTTDSEKNAQKITGRLLKVHLI